MYKGRFGGCKVEHPKRQFDPFCVKGPLNINKKQTRVMVGDSKEGY